MAFRPPNHPHLDLCQPQCSRFTASEREAFCVRALDVMQGKWSIVLLRWPAGCKQGRGRRPCGNGCLEDAMYPTRHLRLSHPCAEGLLIKPKLDTGSNYCIAPRLPLIQGLVLSVCFGGSPAAEEGIRRWEQAASYCLQCEPLWPLLWRLWRVDSTSPEGNFSVNCNQGSIALRIFQFCFLSCCTQLRMQMVVQRLNCLQC